MLVSFRLNKYKKNTFKNVASTLSNFVLFGEDSSIVFGKKQCCTELIPYDARPHLVRPCGLSGCLMYEDQCRSVRVHLPH